MLIVFSGKSCNPQHQNDTVLLHDTDETLSTQCHPTLALHPETGADK